MGKKLNFNFIADSINTDKNVADNKTTHLYKEALQRKYYGMVESLWNSGLLKENVKIIDLGCGLCTTLYNLNLQFKKYELKATFYGVDYNEELLKLFTKHLSQFWKDNKLHVGPKDIMKDCREVLINSSTKNNMEVKTLLFGGERQFLYIKK